MRLNYKSLNCIKYLILFILLIYSCSNSDKNRYTNAENLVKSFIDIKKLNEEDLILVFPKNSGCISCRNYLKNNLSSILLNNSIYVLTDNNLKHESESKIIFDSLNLINTTNLGFDGPALFIKKDNKIEFLVEITAQNKDSILRLIKIETN